MIPLARPSLGAEEIAQLASTLSSGFLSGGPTVAQFEDTIADYLGVKHAIAASSGTAALHLSFLALGLEPEDEVIVPDFSFPATANAVALTGAEPVLCDIDPITFNIDPARIEDLIGPCTRVLMPVHQFGLAANMGEVMRLAEREGLLVVEDAACALGARIDGRKCGTWGILACFSFHPRKVITTGEGGMVVTDRDDIAEKVRSLRNHGRRDGEYTQVGFNYRLSDVQAAVGLAQFAKLPWLLAQRQESAGRYGTSLSGIPGLTLPWTPPGYQHTYQSYVVTLDRDLDRDSVLAALRRDGIEAGIGTFAIHLTTAYRRNRSLQRGDLSASESAYLRTVSLPMYAGMSDAEVAHVCNCLRRELAPML